MLSEEKECGSEERNVGKVGRERIERGCLNDLIHVSKGHRIIFYRRMLPILNYFY